MRLLMLNQDWVEKFLCDTQIHERTDAESRIEKLEFLRSSDIQKQRVW